MARRKDRKPAPTSMREYDFVECRSLGHAWDIHEVSRHPVYGVLIWLKCLRCGMLRKDNVNGYGDIDGRSYAQPDGYRKPDTQRRSFRKELVRRRIEKLS